MASAVRSLADQRLAVAGAGAPAGSSGQALQDRPQVSALWADVPGLSTLMGSSSITTTLDLYGHLYPGDTDRYADRLDDVAGIAWAEPFRSVQAGPTVLTDLS
jgi:hypothetical protein